MQINPKTGEPFKSTPQAREIARKHRAASKQTTRGRAIVLVNNARSRSVKKGVAMELTQAWVESHLERGTCQLTGIPFNLLPPPKGLSRRPDAPSLDRIDKDKHYTEDNTRVILWAVNCTLSEYGTDAMLPILKAMVKGIEDAQALTATSLSAGNNQQSEINSKLGALFTSGIRQDGNDFDHRSGAVHRQDIDHSTQESGGDSMGQRSGEVATPTPSQSIEDHWHLHPTYGWLEY